MKCKVCVGILLVLFVIYIVFCIFFHNVSPNTHLLEKIKQDSVKIELLKIKQDSVIKSKTKKILKIEKHYIKIHDSIIHLNNSNQVKLLSKNLSLYVEIK